MIKKICFQISLLVACSSVIGNNIRVYIHACTIGDWKEILVEQMERLVSSGLYDASEGVYIGVLGKEDISGFFSHYPKLQLAFSSQDVSLYERPTLYCLLEAALLHPGDYFLYIHTKGVTRNRSACVRDWRMLLEYFNIDCWNDCVDALDAGYDICGVNWNNQPHPHYSGNFWWSKGGYLLTLPKNIGREYLAPEMWIGSNHPYFACLHNSSVNHYYTRYPESLYRK
jgi:hypothetical protein